MCAIFRYFGLLFIATSATLTRAEERPNFIVIFTDDQGYADLGAYGIREPFVASWPDRMPAGTVWRKPFIALDIAATINAAARLPPDPAMDGMDLLPLLAAGEDKAPTRDLFWRF